MPVVTEDPIAKFKVIFDRSFDVLSNIRGDDIR
jgi:hypothetical protein